MADRTTEALDGSNTDVAGLRIGVVQSGWYPDIVEGLRAGAEQTAATAGVRPEDLNVVSVPGCFELPQAAAWLARQDAVDALVALGCVVRGQTPHFDVVVRACCDGLLQVALETGIPVGLGVITAETIEQAMERSGSAKGKGGNKGIEAMDAALRMAALYRTLEHRRAAR